MKKILLCIMLLLLMSCSKEETPIVCSTISFDESVEIDVIYNYEKDGSVVGIDKVVTITYDDAQLAEKSLENRYKEAKEDVVDASVIYSVEMIGENRLRSITSIDLTTYDFDTDSYSLGEKEAYSSIAKVIEEVISLGYYKCK